VHIYNSSFTGWQSDLRQAIDNNSIEQKTDGFNCKIPFFKVNHNSKIFFSFNCKQNISIEAGLISKDGELLVAVEKWYHHGEYTLILDVSNLQNELHFLSIKSVGKFVVLGIELQ
jgi:hypothetical protein